MATAGEASSAARRHRYGQAGFRDAGLGLAALLAPSLPQLGLVPPARQPPNPPNSGFRLGVRSHHDLLSRPSRMILQRPKLATARYEASSTCAAPPSP